MNPDNGTVMPSNIEAPERTDRGAYTVSEIAGLLKISKSKAYDLCKQDFFRTVNIGRAVRVSKVSFDKWFDSQ